MISNTKFKKFDLFPVVQIVKASNTLTDRASLDLGIKWRCYYTFTIGWLFWHKTIELYRQK